jgi:Mg-chelatase subunit ChlD
MAKAPRMRALLIGVDTYQGKDQRLRTGQAEANIEAMCRALTEPEHGLFHDAGSQAVVRLPSPALGGDIESAVDQATRSAPDLFLLYYVGHGHLKLGADPAQDQLHLTVGKTDPEHFTETSIALTALVARALANGSERVVLILDTCYSGKLTRHLLDDDRNHSFLTSAGQRQRVTAGEDGGVTPYTAALTQVLRAPRPLHEPLTVHDLNVALRALAEKQPPGTVFPWRPGEYSSGDGANTLMTRFEPRPPADLDVLGLLARLHLRRRLRGFLTRLGHLAKRLWRAAAASRRRRVLTLALVLVLLASGVFALVRSPAAPPCAPPVELRLTTAPEEAAALTDVATAYEDSAFNAACHRSRLSVTGAGTDALREGFTDPESWRTGANNLLSTAGPQPDLLLLQSSAELARLQSPQTRFSKPVHTARDLPVLAVTPAGAQRLGLPDPKAGTLGTVDWPGLSRALARLKDHPRLLRPSPALSATGLVHYLGMGHDVPAAGAADPRGARGTSFTYVPGTPQVTSATRDERERTLIAGGASVVDGTDALCALFARKPGEPYAGALTTARASETFDPEQCARHSVPDTADTTLRLYRVAGAPALDHPLVSVGTQNDPRRAEEVAHFIDWIGTAAGRRALRAAHLDSGAHEESVRLDPARLADQLRTYRAAHPELRVEVVFDVSGSMAEDGKLTGARAAVDEALRHLGGGARYQLRVFPTGRNGEGSTLRQGPWKGTGEDGIAVDSGDLNKDRQANLVSALGQVHADLGAAADAERDTSGEEPPLQYAVLLVTDGDYIKGEKPQLKDLRDLAGRIGRIDGAPVHVVAARPEGCAENHEAAAIADSSGGGCTRLGSGVAATLSRMITALDEGED